MDIAYFIIRYTPFWAIPIMFISAYFTYTFWIKDIRIVALAFSTAGFVATILLIYWILAGGPDASVQQILRFNE